MSYSFENTTTLQLDITTYCNSFCGDCARNIFGGEVQPTVKIAHMQENTWKSIFTSENLQHIEYVFFNGNFGDASMHPELIDFLEYAYSIKPNLIIEMHTNGGARNPEFYANLANTLNKFANHRVIFGIDGIKESSDIYRRGVDFDVVIKNAKAFIKNNGIACWRYIVFDYNIDQIEKAQKMAIDLGFSQFKLNRSVSQEIYMKKYKRFPEQTITAPDRLVVEELTKKYNYYRFSYRPEQNTEINSVCPWAKTGQVQIDFAGNLWPCCYFSLDIFDSVNGAYLNPLKKYNNLNKYSIKEVLNSKYFQKDLPEGWNNNTFKKCTKCQGNTTV
jgi:hypothetical protein